MGDIKKYVKLVCVVSMMWVVCEVSAAAESLDLADATAFVAVALRQLDEADTPLRRAIRAGDVKRVRQLLDSGADPHWVSDDGYNSSPFWLACKSEELDRPEKHAQQREIVQMLYREGADDPELKPWMLRCDILDAIIVADRTLANEYVTRKIMHRAVYNSFDDRENKDSLYALLAAVQMPDVVLDIVAGYHGKRYIRARHPLKSRSTVALRQADSVLREAAATYGGECKLLEALYVGANIGATQYDGSTCLHRVGWTGNNALNRARILLRWGADLEAQDEYGQTPLHCAVIYGNGAEQIIKLFLEHGANLKAKTKNGETPMDIAKRRDKDRLDVAKVGSIVKLLRDHGASDWSCCLQ